MGGDGEDILVGQGGNDIIYGGNDNDQISGDDISLDSSKHGKDELYGDDGDDIIWGGGNDDKIYGGSGDDSLDGDSIETDQQYHGKDEIYGGSGNDKIWGRGNDDLIYGGSGDDLIDGDAINVDGIYHGADTIYGGDGNDIVNGQGGNDTIYGGSGNDYLHGDHEELDEIYHGDDIIYGGDGDDVVVGGFGNNELYGGNGFDTYFIHVKYNEDGEKISHYTNRIFDEDGLGQIVINEKVLLGGFNFDSNSKIFYDDNNKYEIVGGDLFINDDIKVVDFRNHDLNIKLVSFNISIPTIPTPPRDPLTVDLNGDNKISTLHKDYGVHFDLDNSGFAERTSWVGNEDGFFVLDRNNNGRIDGGAELFGTETTLQNGSLAKNGFEALADLDSNADGVFDLNDDLFNDVKIWQDLNSNGIVDEGELQGLKDHNIDKVELNYISINHRDTNNVQHLEKGKAILETGEERLVHTLWFDTDMHLTVPVDIHNGDNVDISSDILPLPDAKGFGNLASLHLSMSQDATGELKNKLLQFVNESDFTLKQLNLDELLFTWSNQENTPIDSRGQYIDARKLGFMERLWGSVYEEQQPSSQMASILNNMYEGVKKKIYFQLVLNDYLDFVSEVVSILPDSGELIYDYKAMWEYVFNEFADSSNLENDFSSLLAVIYGFESYNNSVFNSFRDYYVKLPSVSFGFAEQEIINKLIYVGNNLINLGNRDNLNSGKGDDIVYGTSQNNIIDGDLGNDSIYGYAGHDTLIGGKGNDYLDGGTGSDTYIFSLGDGSDVINSFENNINKLDRIVFKEGVSSEQVSLKRLNNDLVIKYSEKDQITVRDYFDNNGATASRIDQIIFEDETIWDVEYVKQQVLIPTESNDVIRGYSSSDELSGLSGNDSIYGYAGHDTLIGGKGNDHLDGGVGNDTYIFSLGDGQDTIQSFENNANKLDRIVFKEGIDAEDVNLKRQGNDLIVKYSEDDQIAVKNYFDMNGATASRIDQIVFADETVWDVEYIKQQVLIPTESNDMIQGYNSADQLSGLAGNDSLYGYAGNDTLNGGLGNDYLNGGLGNDTYIFSLGDGQDIIDSSENNANKLDRIVFNEEITPENLTLKRQNNDLIVRYSEQDQITVRNYFDSNGATISRIDQIVFADETVWDVEYINNRVLEVSDDDDEIHGYAGDDVLSSLAGNDKVYGNAGNDTLIGGLGNDYLNGGSGNDTYVFAPDFGHDIINNYDTGIDRQDTIQFVDGLVQSDFSFRRHNNDLMIRTLDGENSIIVQNFFQSDALGHYRIDQIQFSDSTILDVEAVKALVLLGTVESDILIAYETGSTISGEAGDDVIHGNIGSDQLYGGSGLDTLYGGDGDDLLDGGADNDKLYGGSGDDTLIGESGNDRLEGGDGNDYLNGGSDDDQLYGGVGDDTIIGGSGDDRLDGGDGNDHLQGGADNDILIAGSGNDILIGGTGNDQLFGGNGNDTYIFAPHFGHDIIDNYDSTTNRQDIIQFIDGLVQSNFSFRRHNDDLVIRTLEGENSITVQNYFQSDALGHYRIDQIQFSDNTVLDIEAVKALVLLGTAEADILRAYTTGSTISSEAGDDIIHGNIGSDQLYGGEGQDQLYGGVGHDLLDGGAGSDLLNGGTGDDVLVGGSGDDVLIGGQGNDIYRFDLGWGQDTIQYESKNQTDVDVIEFININPNDLIVRKVGQDMVIVHRTTGDQLVVESHFSDYLSNKPINIIRFDDQTEWDEAAINIQAVKGTELDDIIEGTTDQDVIHAGAGDDIIYGRSVYSENPETQYFVYGGNGNDKIYATGYLDGGAGDDEIEGSGHLLGGDGNDILTGQGVLEGQSGNDIITGQGKLYGGDGQDHLTLTGLGHDELGLLSGGSGDDIIIVDVNRRQFVDSYNQNDFIHNEDGYHAIQDIELTEAQRAVYVEGGQGNDTIYGSFGDEVYLFNLGDGQDTIIERPAGQNYNNVAVSFDVLRFGQNIVTTDISLHRYGTDLVIKHTNQTDQITIQNYFVGGHHKINEIQFADSTTWDNIYIENHVTYHGTSDHDEVWGYRNTHETFEMGDGDDKVYSGVGNDIIYGQAGNDTLWGQAGNDTLYGGTGADYLEGNEGDDILHGDEGNDILYGGDGNDILYGGDGDDTLRGGAGHDILNGGAGNDKYFYYLTDGQETIDQTGGGTDVLWLMDQGITEDRIKFTKENNDLLVTIDNNSNQSIRVKDHFLGGEKAISSVQPNGGYTITAAQIAVKVNASSGGSSDPVGDTIYQYSSGSMIITEHSGQDTVLFKNGITFSQVGNYLNKSGNDLILKVNGSNTNKVTVKNFFLGGDHLVETFQFETGGQLTAEQIFGAFGLTIPTSPIEPENPEPSIPESPEVVGDTTYNYTSGELIITEHSGNDKVIFKNGITFSQVGNYLNKSGEDLILKVNGSNTNKVTVKNFFLGGDYLVETFQFETGGQITAEQIFGVFGITMPTTSEPETPTEPETPNVVGDTTYEYTTGALTITEHSGNDKVIFKNGITFNQVGSYLTKSGDDLILKVDGSNTNKVTVKNFFLGGQYLVEIFQFETGGQITAEQIFGAFGMTVPQQSSPANVPPESTDLDAFNTIYNYSSGAMVIDEKLGTDQVIFGNGITFSQIGNYLTKSGDDLILKVNGSNTNKVTVKDFFLGGAHEVESFSFETGGSISSDQLYQVFGVDRPVNAEDEVTSIILGDQGDNILSSDAAVSELFILDEGNDILQLLLNASGETAVDYVSDFNLVEDQIDLSQILDSHANDSNLSGYIEIIYDTVAKTNTWNVRSEANGDYQELLVMTNQSEQVYLQDLINNQNIIY
ncbi:calcium-binding protein [Acinetobacter haemolyticus]|uniref:calcium-binding protein n=1 Tax=Acinetobacter haemolyticus TaxID=29430 RepID=UPI0024DEF1DA|nr:calcium-binding protein [Acinetobacter haemolyticus]